MAIFTQILSTSELEFPPRLLDFTVALSSAYVVFWISRAFYRLTLHPLASFPGPKFAAISVWWLYREGKARDIETSLRALHKKYDTHILRIGPNELHIDDVSVYDEIYSQKYRFLKEPDFYASFNAANTVFSEGVPAAHRELRKIISPFFSRQRIVAVEPTIYAKVNLMVNKMRDFQDQGAIHLYSAIRCLTVDFISEYSFGKSFGLLEDAKDHTFRPGILLAFDMATEVIITFRYFPIVRHFTNLLPASLMAVFSERISKVKELGMALADAMSSFDKARADGQKFEHLPLFDPLSNMSKKYIEAECLDIMVAGSDTTATCLGYLMNAVIANPDILQKLRAELDAGLPDKDANWPLLELEKFEYLTACIKETLRCAIPVPGRLPRVVPTPQPGAPPFIVDGKVIAPGSIVGISARAMHYNESVWGPDSEVFKPERWLEPDSNQLEKFLVAFGKGGRQCLGMNLAYAELRIATSKLFRCLDMSLDSKMTKKDLNQIDYFTTTFEGTGVRVLVRGERP
ncbi:da207784-86f9-43fb-b67d-03a6ef638b7e [Sclerotinia trifoliorum]|uniref:Da207784-86f9-43fb-b67d-03a6ef638b7e n=1 Tax=Sclerotinia trifoliorum TaxID=28548 RepID=A0A8H2VWM4_9HELO|nr:da207784-86f9-43fb-b67d-03a6ef638b7e [Sclerotinia trifoliorum]